MEITPPLTETAYSAREFFSTQVKQSADGLFTVVYRPLKTIVFKDVDLKTVAMHFKEPPNA